MGETAAHPHKKATRVTCLPGEPQPPRVPRYILPVKCGDVMPMPFEKEEPGTCWKMKFDEMNYGVCLRPKRCGEAEIH